MGITVENFFFPEFLNGFSVKVSTRRKGKHFKICVFPLRNISIPTIENKTAHICLSANSAELAVLAALAKSCRKPH